MAGKASDDPYQPFSASRAADRFDILMSEAQSIRNTNDMIDETIQVGVAASERLLTQGARIGQSNTTLQQMIGNLPGIRYVGGLIEVKRKRDRLILGSLIGFLMFFFVWYLFG